MRVFVAVAAAVATLQSTESGVPDYRSPGRPPHRPTSHQQFMSSHLTRQRYWARSLQGFDTLALSKPNGGHVALAYSARHGGPVKHVITQNVDNLHEEAGSPSVLHLHGTINSVRCMSCDAVSSRAEYQALLAKLNPAFVKKHYQQQSSHHAAPATTTTTPQHHSLTVAASHSSHLISPLGTSPVTLPSSSSSPSQLVSSLRPDGDVDLPQDLDFSTFVIPSCPLCTDGEGHPKDPVEAAHVSAEDSRALAAGEGVQPMRCGVTKPDLVFFGANVPPHRHARADQLLQQADAILVVGTSLTVWSAFRLLRHTLDRVVPGQQISVVQLADQWARQAKLLQQQQQQEQNGSDSSSGGGGDSNGGNFIVDGTAILSPVTPFQATLDSSSSSSSSSATRPRVPSVIPIVILNQGPTRMDPLVAAASNIVKIEHTRASHALNFILDVPEQVQLEAMQPSQEQQQQMQDGRLMRAEYEQIAQRNIDIARLQKENIE